MAKMNETKRDKPDGFRAGDYVFLADTNGSGTVRKVSRVARDGRVQIGSDWYTPGTPDKWGRFVRSLTNRERYQNALSVRQEVALEKLRGHRLSKAAVEALERLAKKECGDGKEGGR